MLRPVISETKVKAVRDLLQESERIVITCHMAPDGDAVGSSLGLLHTLANIGKEVRIVTPDRIPETLRFLPGAKDIVPYSKYTEFAGKLLNDADLIFCLDFNALYRVDRMKDALEQSKAKKILVDHHESPQDFTDVAISHPDQSSTSMLLFRLLCRLELFNMIDRKAATCIYTGMMTDTGNFSYNCSDPELYIVVAELLKKGADKERLYRALFNTYSENCLRLNAYAILNRMEVYPEDGAALIVLSRDELNRYHYAKGDTEGLVNRPLSIPGIHYSAFLREEADMVKVSMRSVGDFPVNILCKEYFGGGGHLNASGGEFYGTLDEAATLFRSLLKENKKKYLANVKD